MPFQVIRTFSQYKDGFIKANEFEVIYRWSATYRNSIIAKFSRLQEWFEANRSDVSFITYTGSSVGLTVEEHWNWLIKCKSKLMMAIRRILRYKFDFVWATEPHPGHGVNHGYPHIHMTLFHGLTELEIIKLKKLWESYGFGSFDNGLDIQVKKSQDKIDSIKNYLLKYICKSWTESGGKYSKSHWDKHLFIFNMIAWKNQFRFWGCSRALSKVMAYVPHPNSLLIPKTCIHIHYRDSELCQFGAKLWSAATDKLSEAADKYLSWRKESLRYNFSDFNFAGVV